MSAEAVTSGWSENELIGALDFVGDAVLGYEQASSKKGNKRRARKPFSTASIGLRYMYILSRAPTAEKRSARGVYEKHTLEKRQQEINE